jgi:hypothetical protein
MRKNSLVSAAIAILQASVLSTPALAHFEALSHWVGACAQSEGVVSPSPPTRSQINEQLELDRIEKALREEQQRANRAAQDDRAGSAAGSRQDWKEAAGEFLAALNLEPDNAEYRAHLENANYMLQAQQTSSEIADLRKEVETEIAADEIVALRRQEERQSRSEELAALYKSILAERCRTMQLDVDQVTDDARRANLALDVYSFFDDNHGYVQPTLWQKLFPKVWNYFYGDESKQLKTAAWQAPWKAPAGYSLISNNILATRKLLPDMDSATIKRFLAPDNSEYRAAIYRNDSTGALILSFRGSENNWDNWGHANIPNELGQETEYFRRAAILAVYLKRYSNAHGLQLECTGHSLGGGMCINAAIHARIKATVFNAETVHSAALLRGDNIALAERLVVNYTTAHEVVTGAQSALFIPAPGFRVRLPDWSGGPKSPVARHKMWFVRLSMQNRLRELMKDKADNGCAL